MLGRQVLHPLRTQWVSISLESLGLPRIARPLVVLVIEGLLKARLGEAWSGGCHLGGPQITFGAEVDLQGI